MSSVTAHELVAYDDHQAVAIAVAKLANKMRKSNRRSQREKEENEMQRNKTKRDKMKK